MKDAEKLFELLISQPLVAVGILSIAVIFAALLKAAQVAAEILTKRWLTPAPVPPILPNGSDEVEQGHAPRSLSPDLAAKVLGLKKISFAVAMAVGLVAAFVWATWSVDTFEGRDANGQPCVGTSLFGFEDGSCMPITTHFDGIEGFE